MTSNAQSMSNSTPVHTMNTPVHTINTLASLDPLVNIAFYPACLIIELSIIIKSMKVLCTIMIYIHVCLRLISEVFFVLLRFYINFIINVLFSQVSTSTGTTTIILPAIGAHTATTIPVTAANAATGIGMTFTSHRLAPRDPGPLAKRRRVSASSTDSGKWFRFK